MKYARSVRRKRSKPAEYKRAASAFAGNTARQHLRDRLTQPVCLMTAARKRPAPGQAEAPRHRDGRTLWQQGASDDGVGATTIHFP